MTEMESLATDSINSTGTPDSTTVCENMYCVSNEEYMDRLEAYLFPSPFEWVLIVLYTIVFIVGLTGNFLVCFAVWRNHHMRTVTNYFIVNLAVADFMVILICLPPTVLTDVTETWYMGSVMCKIVHYLQTVSVTVSVLTLSVISIDRWYAICQPLRFKSTTTRARGMIILIWIAGLCVPVPELVVLDVQPWSPAFVFLSSCKPMYWEYKYQRAYSLFLIGVTYLLPLMLMALTYAHIAICLWKRSIPTEQSRRPLTSHSPSHGAARSSTETQISARRKAAKMLIAVVIMFALCYLPVHLLNILRYSRALKSNDTALVFALISHLLCYFNSAINPVIYNFMSDKFRCAFRHTLASCNCPCSNTPHSDYYSSYKYTTKRPTYL